jgi:serine/threonine-protein kinase
MPLVSGATAAGFKIIRLLGRGQNGEVYLAEHPRFPRRHALKILPADVSADPEYRERFNRESDLAAVLWHPHIVGLHDRGEFEGRLWLSVDYVDGADAAQLLSDTYPDGMPPDEVVEIVTAVADALDYAHEHGVVHRHVKPGNILITQPASGKRRILLADFGVARRSDDINGFNPTNMTLGAVSYAAPEQLKGGSIDGRADQYALAGTAFHLLTGSPPFAHSNPAVVIGKHLNESPPRPGDVRPELAHFDEPFARALAKVPNDRFPRCQDFAKALEANHSTQSNLQEAETDAVALAEPALPAPPDAEADIAVAPPDVPPDAGVGDAVTSPEPAVSVATTDDKPVTSGRRRLPRAAAILLTVVMVVLIGFVIVMALRSRFESQRAPTNVETPSSVTTIPPALPPPPTATTTPAPPTTTPPATTAPPTASTPSLPETSMPPTTAPPSPPTSPVAGIDSRPAVGMPCGPQQTGATTVSNSGVPVSCVGTPGGFAWEPSGYTWESPGG